MHQLKDYVAKLGRQRTRLSNAADSNKDTWLRTDGQVVAVKRRQDMLR